MNEMNEIILIPKIQNSQGTVPGDDQKSIKLKCVVHPLQKYEQNI